MMTAPASVVSYLAGLTSGARVGFRADLYTFTLSDGSAFWWTTCDRNIVYGGNTYLANGAVIKRSNIRKTSRLEVDSLSVELSAVLPLPGSLSPLAASLAMGLTTLSLGQLTTRGLFFGARMKIDHLVGPDLPTTLSWGPIPAWFDGRVAAASLSGNVIRLAIESDLGALDKTMLPRFVFQPGCRNAVYDPNCSLVKATFTDAGTASGTLSTTQVQSTTAAIIAKANGFYELGVLKFTAGTLIGTRRAVKTFTVSGGTATITLALPLGNAPIATDTFNLYPGCDRKQATCVSKFNNLVNFRGFPHVPATEGAA